MHAENFLVDESCDRKTIEAVCEDFPKLDTVTALALVIEAVDAIDRGTFMISSQQKEVLWVLDLIGQKEADGFERLLSSIDIVSKEEIVGVRRESTVFKHAQQVVVLSVNVTFEIKSK